MRFAVEGSGENRGLSDKLDSEEKEKITDALQDGQYWIDSNPKADVDKRMRSNGLNVNSLAMITVVEKDSIEFIHLRITSFSFPSGAKLGRDQVHVQKSFGHSITEKLLKRMAPSSLSFAEHLHQDHGGSS